jgi:hypothetical protein
MRFNTALFICIIVAGFITGNNAFAQVKRNKPAISGVKAAPPALVYKTRKDYSNNVAVILSDDKKTIVSYPDPKDITKENNYLKPTKLKKGYLLDNRGVGPNVAYLKMTCAQYAALPKAPSLNALMKMIIDKNPMTELYNCGNRYVYKNVAGDLDSVIQAGKLKKACTVLK